MAGFGTSKRGKKKKENTPQRTQRINGIALFKSAIDYHSQGDLSNAEKTYRSAIDLGISNFAIFSNLGIICQVTQRKEEAIALYKKAIALSPDQPDPYTNAGSLFQELGNLDKALSYTLKSLALKPDNPDGLMNLGGIYKSLGNFDKALASTLKSLELNPHNHTAHMYLGGIYKDLGNLDQALASTLISLELKPNNPDAHLNLGGIYKDLGNLDQALTSTLKSLELKPDDPNALINLGGIYKDLGNLDQALAFTLQSLQLKPENHIAHFNLGGIHKDLDNLDQALASTLQSLELEPNNPKALMNLGGIYKDLGNLDQALASTLQSIKLEPNNPKALMNMGGIYKDLGNLDQALASTLQSLKLEPNNPKALMNMGGLNKELGHLDQALNCTLKSLELKPDNPTAHMNLGSIYKDLGNLDQALTSTLESLKLKPEDSKALYILGTIKIAQGDMQEARKYLLNSIENNPQEYAAYYTLSKMLKSTEEAGELIKSIYSAKITGGTPLDKSLIEFAISNCFHQVKNYAHASKHLRLANKYKLMAIPSNAESRQHEIANNLARCNSPEKTTDNIKSGKERIFIVGLPRSGSTLLETILSMSPEIEDLGESTSLKIAISKFREQEQDNSNYQNLNEIYSQMEPTSNAKVKYTTDKNLYNFIYISFIVSHMPAARIIHCRRNPMDHILSMHRSNLSRGNSYTENIEDAAKVLIAQEKAMQIQKDRHPEKIFTFDYDQFVNMPEVYLRNLMKWLRLEFHDHYLHPEKSTRIVNTASVLQARKPISNSSVGGWKNYKDLLKPALKILEESGIKIK